MDPDRKEDVFSDGEDLFPVREDREEEDEQEEEDEEEDARIFTAWMQQYRGAENQKKQEEREDGEAEGGNPESRSSSVPSTQTRMDRRASLPCPVSKPKMLLMLSERQVSYDCSLGSVDGFCPRVQNSCRSQYPAKVNECVT